MIAITGIGACSALGSTLAATFDGVCAGRSGIGPGPAWADGVPVAAIPGGPHLGSDLAEAVVRAALGTLAPAGLGLVGASTAGDMKLGEPAHFELLGRGTVSAGFLWTQLPDAPTAEVARRLGISGPRLTVSTACTSGAVAIGVAADWVRRGRVPAAIAFGVDALCGTTVHGFRSLGLVSADRCRPFDVARSGMTVGEGAAAVLLESREHAVARGAEILGWVSGYGSASDAHHMTAPHPEGVGVRAAIRAALAQADVTSVDYVSAHGTATSLNDAMEAAVLIEELPRVPVSSVKGALGHTLGAAGALEVALSVEALRRGVLPPNVGVRQGIEGVALVRTSRAAPISRALSLNMAFGGSCSALVLEAA